MQKNVLAKKFFGSFKVHQDQFGKVKTIQNDIANDEVTQFLPGGHGQLGGPQVPFLGHGNVIDKITYLLNSNQCSKCNRGARFENFLVISYRLQMYPIG